MSIRNTVPVRHSSIRMSWIALCAAALLSLGGCGQKVIQNSGTETDASKVLTTALDAWVAGKKPDDLRTGTPPIAMTDFDWQQGKQLKSFQLSNPPKDQGNFWKVSAVLTIAGPGEPESQQLAAYNIVLQPSVVIGRTDDGHIPN